MKIDRLMAILTILLRQEKITAPELADRLEVSYLQATKAEKDKAHRDK